MKPTKAQRRVLEALAEGEGLVLHPSLGNFDSGGYRWEFRGHGRRNPTGATMAALNRNGLVRHVREGRQWPYTHRVTITPAGRAALEEGAF